MKKYIAIFGFALSFLISDGVRADDKTNDIKVEETEVKEITYDEKAPAALIGETIITVGDVKHIYDNNAQLKVVPFNVIFPRLVEEMVKAKVILAEAMAANTAELPEVKKVIKEQTDNIVSTFYLLNKVNEKKTENELEKLYKETYKPEEEIRAKHIVVKTEKEADEIMKKLKKGESFEKLADEVSLDKSSEGGDIGYFTKDTFGEGFKDFTEMAFKTKKGAISKSPVETSMGFHIIKVEDKRETTPPAFEKVKAEIENRFAIKTSEELVKDLISKAKIKTYNLEPKTEIEIKTEVVKETK